jgi:hypothetical protein
MSLELFLDQMSSTNRDVTKDVKTLFQCLIPTDASVKNKKPSPPLVRFHWGDGQENFLAYVKSVQAKYTLFGQEGKPIRAACTLSLEEMPEDADKQNPTSGTLEIHASHTVVEGDTLHSIAYSEYRNPNEWRRIAEENGIDDPMRLETGRRLLIPPPDRAVGN